MIREWKSGPTHHKNLKPKKAGLMVCQRTVLAFAEGWCGCRGVWVVSMGASGAFFSLFLIPFFFLKHLRQIVGGRLQLHGSRFSHPYKRQKAHIAVMISNGQILRC